ncbi:MAG TPA: error-prone DNA polymerase, partial [Rhodanobacteraceae bacterium]|nr:error-prone DNA polymerase [Rhodanobacteraceae bacterium]
MKPYAELHCLSNFSFQRGASSARELFERAQELGYAALAITDECSLAGIVRAWDMSRDTGLPLIVGGEFQLDDGPKLVLLVEDHAGYTELCRLITLARGRVAKGRYLLYRRDLEKLAGGLCVLWTPGPLHQATAPRRDEHACWVARHFAGRAWLAVELHRGPDDAGELATLRDLGTRHGLPLVAAGDVHMHVRTRRALQDLLTAIRLGTTVANAGDALFPNGERHLRACRTLASVYPRELLDETLRIAARCTFRMDGLDYEYPHELVPPGRSRSEHLRALAWAGAQRRWPQGVPVAVAATIERELALIAYKAYEAFFLTVEDIVRFARSRGILCQGRGSAANSAVCYCLGITSVAPDKVDLLFERFMSRQRDEPPDIDVDFEHERREEVIQYIFAKYGRGRAALAATVISYQPRSAARDVGRALGFSSDQLEQLSRIFGRGQGGTPIAERLRERGFDPGQRVIRQLLVLVEALLDFPRHLSQHVGGFVISEHPLDRLVPVENAAMAGRTVIQWDKDDLESLGLLKVDCLALGMLTCLRKCFALLREHGGPDLDLAGVPLDDARTYDMICRADTIGTFQIESRAQMSMLPRLLPRCYYDLVVQVAIVRPGPIQGGMVHPYLQRRKLAPDSIDYASPGVRRVLGRTLGVPIFQEQVMALLQEVAGFSADEADDLRRSMAAWKRRGGVEKFEPRIRERMAANGYASDYVEQIIQQIRGFGSYGFPESHAASFALLAYASAWLKCHHPAAFACALLNAQPMGFYAPAQIVQDARRHGVEVRPADVTRSAWDCTLEAASLRLGLRMIHGLGEDMAARVVAARACAPFRDLADLSRRAALQAGERQRLARAGALHALSGHRHRAYWESAGIEQRLPLLDAAEGREARVALRPPSLAEDVLTDYATQGLSLDRHPVGLVRAALTRRRARQAGEIETMGNGMRLRHAGLVTVRQRPQTAAGVTFVTLEDETGQVNVVIWRQLAERQRRVLLESVLLGVDGVLQESHGVRHLVAHRLHDFSALLPRLGGQSRD